MSHGNKGNTDPHFRPEGDPIRREIVRFKVVRGTVRPDPDEPENADLATPTLVFICHIWDGTNEGTQEVPIALSEPAAPDQIIYACRPHGGTDETNPESAETPGDATTEDRVIWREVFVEGRQYWIEITGSAPLTGAYNRWGYGWELRVPLRHGMFKAPDEAYTSGSTGVTAYNSVEANNSDSGWQGNSVNLDSLPVGVQIQPVSGNPVVRAWPITNCDGDAEMMFSYENAITNVCPE